MVTYLSLTRHTNTAQSLPSVLKEGSIFQAYICTHTHTQCIYVSMKEIYNQAKCLNLAQRVIKIENPPNTDFEAHNKLYR